MRDNDKEPVEQSKEQEEQIIKMPNGGTLVVRGNPSPEQWRRFVKILLESEKKWRKV